MKVKFCCDNGANIHSKKVRTFDTVRDLHLDGGEWEKMTEDEKHKILECWANEQYEYWYEEEK